jgi:hypothetical protein
LAASVAGARRNLALAAGGAGRLQRTRSTARRHAGRWYCAHARRRPPDAPDDAQQELPPQVASALRLLRAPTRPRYRSLGSLDRAARHPAAARPGLYLIEFLVNGKPQAYSGKAADVRTRLRDHLREVRRWGVPPAGYQVYAAFNAAYADPETLRRVEAALHDALFRASRGYLRNRQREF